MVSPITLQLDPRVYIAHLVCNRCKPDFVSLRIVYSLSALCTQACSTCPMYRLTRLLHGCACYRAARYYVPSHSTEPGEQCRGFLVPPSTSAFFGAGNQEPESRIAVRGRQNCSVNLNQRSNATARLRLEGNAREG